MFSYTHASSATDCEGFETCVPKPVGCGSGTYSGKASIDSNTALSIT
jgi:hypothetical protein